jgi:tetratricopeptide (TPR) repeat protein
MEREIVGKRPTFRPARPRTSFYRIMLWLSLILAGIWILLGYRRGQIQPPFQPTPTPTRMAQSYLLEAQAYFDAGKLDDPDPPQPTPPRPDAIDTYRRALQVEPDNAQVWAELARIQAYSSSLLRNDTERLARLEEAVESANKARDLAPDDSTILAIRAFVLDWYAFMVPKERSEELLAEAYSEAVRAYQLDPNNALALAYYAEILNDQNKWLQAERYAFDAVTRDPTLMDTHRVYGYVLENLGQYKSAIEQYQKAAEIAPNLTFLYILIGRLYREGIDDPDRALEYFAQAADIDKQLGVQNPRPYIEIAKTYTQQGQFFVAARNAEKALEYDKSNADTYGQLGIIFIQARNYEGALPLLKCAVRSCEAKDNEMGQADVQGLPLTNKTVAYYYVELGTVMAFLSKPNENLCPEARKVLQEVRLAYPDDPILVAIVEDSEGLCRRLEGGAPAAQPSPTPGAEAKPDM